jgi:hypothetical protein
MKRLLRITVVGSILLLPIVASALTYTLLEPITGFIPTQAPATLEEYLVGLFRLAIGVAGVLAVIRITWCGFNLMTSVNPSAKEDAKECIKMSIFGLLLAFGSFMIINSVRVGSIGGVAVQNPLNLPPTAGGTGSVQAPTGTPVCTITSSNVTLFEGQVTNISASCTPRALTFAWESSAGAPLIQGGGNFIAFPSAGTFTYIVRGSNTLGTGAPSQVLTVTVSPRAAPACSQDMPRPVEGPITCAQSNTTLNWSALGSGERAEAVVLGNAQSLSVQFTTAGGGAYGSFTTRAITGTTTIAVGISTSTNATQDFTVNNPTNLNPIKYANISRAACDFRYENLSRSLCAISGSNITLDFQVGAGSPPSGGRPGCVLEPNTAYIINVRNENAVVGSGNRTVDTCPISGTCEFTARLIQSQGSQFTPRLVEACAPEEIIENPGPTVTFTNLLNNSVTQSENVSFSFSASDPVRINSVQFTVYNLDTGAIVDSLTPCVGAGSGNVPSCGASFSDTINLRVGPGQGSYRVQATVCSSGGTCTTQNRVVVVDRPCLGGGGLTCFDLPVRPATNGEMCAPEYGNVGTVAQDQTHGYRFRLAPGEYARVVVVNRPIVSCPYIDPFGYMGY